MLVWRPHHTSDTFSGYVMVEPSVPSIANTSVAGPTEPLDTSTSNTTPNTSDRPVSSAALLAASTVSSGPYGVQTIRLLHPQRAPSSVPPTSSPPSVLPTSLSLFTLVQPSTAQPCMSRTTSTNAASGFLPRFTASTLPCTLPPPLQAYSFAGTSNNPVSAPYDTSVGTFSGTPFGPHYEARG